MCLATAPSIAAEKISALKQLAGDTRAWHMPACEQKRLIVGACMHRARPIAELRMLRELHTWKPTVRGWQGGPA